MHLLHGPFLFFCQWFRHLFFHHVRGGGLYKSRHARKTPRYNTETHAWCSAIAQHQAHMEDLVLFRCLFETCQTLALFELLSFAFISGRRERPPLGRGKERNRSWGQTNTTAAVCATLQDWVVQHAKQRAGEKYRAPARRHMVGGKATLSFQIE